MRLAWLAAACVFAQILSAGWAFGQGTAVELERRGNMTIARNASTVWAVTHRAGFLGFLGHEHAITAESWSARLCWIESEPTRSFFDMVVPTNSVRIDTERGLELAGLASSPDPSTVEDLQRRMLGSEFLAAERFPQLRFRSTSVEPRDEDPLSDASAADDPLGADADPDLDLRVTGDLTLHGRTQSIDVPVRIQRLDTGAFTFSAHVTFRMTDFGITPESTIGVIDVADELDLYVEIVAHRTAPDCAR